MNEIWKDIPGYEGYFKVSNLGNFKSLDRIVKYKNDGTRVYPGKPLKVEQMQDGYCRIVLMKNSIKKRYMCHRLVAETFIPNPNNKLFVNHINGIRSDNSVSNLEWCTQEENEQHSIKVLGKTMKGKTASKKVYCKELNCYFKSMRQAVDYLGNRACNEGIKKAIEAKRPYHGYTFSFVDESSTTIENTSNGSEQSTLK